MNQASIYRIVPNRIDPAADIIDGFELPLFG